MKASGSVVTRFAPSPTGDLHIGGARTALFNWMYAKKNSGSFLLRIEDTDRVRSSQEMTEKICLALRWLGLDWHEDAVSQYSRRDRHKEVAYKLLDMGAAYKCYESTEAIAKIKEEKAKKGQSLSSFRSPWRDAGNVPPSNSDKDYVIRIKVPEDGFSEVKDIVQGNVRWSNSDLDDFIILRSDGTPTYMLSVVVDDHDMGVTHIIRGDDHLTNSARQSLIYIAMGWDIPFHTHIPMILGEDGARLSKRHGATGLLSYKDAGYLPEAMCNYLARLGWGHGDHEIFSVGQAVEWFSLEALGKSPSRFDKKKLDSVNAHYLRNLPYSRIEELFNDFCNSRGCSPFGYCGREKFMRSLPELVLRSNNFDELYESSYYLRAKPPIDIEDSSKSLLTEDALKLIRECCQLLEDFEGWESASLENAVRLFVKDKGVGLKSLAQPLRVLLTGKKSSPGLFFVMEILGKEECLSRLSRTMRYGND